MKKYDKQNSLKYNFLMSTIDNMKLSISIEMKRISKFKQDCFIGRAELGDVW